MIGAKLWPGEKVLDEATTDSKLANVILLAPGLAPALCISLLGGRYLMKFKAWRLYLVPSESFCT